MMMVLGLCGATHSYSLVRGGNVPSGGRHWGRYNWLCCHDGNEELTMRICANGSSRRGRGKKEVKPPQPMDGLKGKVRSNAKRVKEGLSARPTLGIDYGEVRTGIAVSRGYFPRPLQVVKHRGQKLEAYLIQSAEKEGADEFVIGLPKSSDGLETDQSCKVRSFAGRLAALAALRGWRVYLQDEHGTSEDALDYMIEMGSSKRSRKEQLDAYAAVVVLQRYFERDEAELMFPKDSKLHLLLLQGPANMRYDDDDDEDDACFE